MGLLRHNGSTPDCTHLRIIKFNSEDKKADGQIIARRPTGPRIMLKPETES